MAFKTRILTRNGEKVSVTSNLKYLALKAQGWTDATPTTAGDFDNIVNTDVLGTWQAIPNTVVRRSADNYLEAAHMGATQQPADPWHLTRKDYVDGIGDSNATLNTIMRREGGGNTALNGLWLAAQYTDAPEWAARVGYVDGGSYRSSLIVTRNETWTSQGWTNVILPGITADTSDGYNETTGIYTIPVTGTYDVLATLRLLDGTVPAGNANLGIGVDVVGTNDSPFFAWYVIPGGMRKSFIYNQTRRLVAGDQVRMFTYADNGGTDLTGQAASLSITQVRR